MAGWHVAGEFGGLLTLLHDGNFSDIAIELTDDHRLQAHRVLLAAASDVLKAKFLIHMSDSASSVWRPEKGSSSAWQWIVGWIYGSPDELPTELFVEAMVIADYFQMKALVCKLLELDLEDKQASIALQLLRVDSCPVVLVEVAARCVPECLSPAGNTLPELLTALLKAKLPNVALVVKFLRTHTTSLASVGPCKKQEEDRLLLLGARLKQEAGFSLAFPDCFVDAVRWDEFPAEALAQVHSGSMGYFKDFLGCFSTEESSSTMKKVALEALVARCQKFELPDPIPEVSERGLFEQLKQEHCRIHIDLSSKHSNNHEGPEQNVLSRDHCNFGTAAQSRDNHPWMMLKSLDAAIRPTAVGLMHGWTANQDQCKDFVLEGARGDNAWEELLRVTQHPLREKCEIFPLQPSGESANNILRHQWFDRFRLMMTGPTSTGSWYLMVSWFDVYGEKTLMPLTDALDAAADAIEHDVGAAATQGAGDVAIPSKQERIRS